MISRPQSSVTHRRDFADREGSFPLCSIVVPCRNEAKFINRCLDSILDNDYPKERLEILVVDGMSDDGTKSILNEYTLRHPCVRILPNQKRNTPAALNIGIKAASGEVIIRMDAHSQYPSSYVFDCVESLRRTGADVVGGPVVTRAASDTLVARSIALITSHPFGVGNSKFRTSQQEGFVDTVPFGAYRREVLLSVGSFDERLLRNQDNELSSRIISKGGKIYFTPKLTAIYFNQSTLSGFLRQAVKTGMWNVMTIKINPRAFRWRHFIPLLFVTAMFVFGLVGLMFPSLRVLFAALSSVYLLLAVGSSFHLSMKIGSIYLFVLPLLFFLYHVSYGAGTVAGLVKFYLLVNKVRRSIG